MTQLSHEHTHQWWVTVRSKSFVHTSLIVNKGVVLLFPCTAIIYKYKNEVGCRDDTVPKTVDTRRHCEEE